MRRAGFSQVEILVVVFIIGLMAGVAALTLPDAGSGLEEEAQDFAGRLRMLAQESVLTGRSLGVMLSGEGYAFQERRGGEWRPMASSRFFAPVRWREGTQVEALRDAGPARRLSAGNGGRERARVPGIRFEPVGLATPFRIVLTRSGPGSEERYVVSGDETGSVTVEPEGARR